VVDAIYDALSNMCWSGKIAGFHEKEDILCLSQYATTGWLLITHENQMLVLLSHNIINYSPSATEITIESTYFAHSLFKAFDYHHKQSYKRPLHALGQSLASGARKIMGTVVNTMDTHWLAIVLDFSTRTIWHGDSLQWVMEPKLKAALKWWTSEYTSAQFKYKPLPITYQKDSFSCGLLTWNAISHFFLPKLHPLIDPTDVATERLRVLLCVCKQHQNEVS
jgi:Ulp1 protease family, C-terminal catalytic domain